MTKLTPAAGDKVKHNGKNYKVRQLLGVDRIVVEAHEGELGGIHVLPIDDVEVVTKATTSAKSTVGTKVEMPPPKLSNESQEKQTKE